MGKKNIKPNLNQPVIRTNLSLPALSGLSEENLTTGWTAAEGGMPSQIIRGTPRGACSYDGDDAE